MQQLSKQLLSYLLLLFSIPLLALEVGESAPAFERTELQTRQTTGLADYRGSVVYLDFWASWCGPCRLSLPAMDDLYRELSPQGFQVIAVNVDQDIQDAHHFLKSHPVSYPVLQDDGSLPKRFGVLGMPTAYLLDRRGRVRLVHQGFRPGDEQKLRQHIVVLLKEPLPAGENTL